jgi:hypothetical protein
MNYRYNPYQGPFSDNQDLIADLDQTINRLTDLKEALEKGQMWDHEIIIGTLRHILDEDFDILSEWLEV